METKEQGNPGPTARVTARTSISKGISIKGEITSHEDLQVDGNIEASISAGGHCVTIGQTAHVTAEITAREVVVYGTVKGDVYAFDRMDVKRGASVVGDVTTSKIMIEDGAYFKGAIEVDGKNPPVGADLGTLLARAEKQH